MGDEYQITPLKSARRIHPSAFPYRTVAKILTASSAARADVSSRPFGDFKGKELDDVPQGSWPPHEGPPFTRPAPPAHCPFLAQFRRHVRDARRGQREVAEFADNAP
jgi:hypothetical protein